MENRNHPRGLPLPAPRIAMPRRTSSSSSEASHASNTSHISEEQFVFSPLNTPAREETPSRAMALASGGARNTSATRDRLLFGKEINLHSQESSKTSAPREEVELAPNSKTNPIAIEPSVGARIDPISATASNPPEPLSARGDIPGGYFPLHEDPKSRVRIPHPFHTDTDMARHQSVQRAAEASKSSSNSPTSGAMNSFKPSQSLFPNSTSSSGTPLTPLSSYNPHGGHDDVGLPLGKYYPSNWEKRNGEARQPRPSAPQPTSGTMRSEPQVPTYHGDQGVVRPGSEAKRRLQQYQRDMIAQATMAARAVLANSTFATNGAVPSNGGAGPSKGQLAATFLKTHKPISPRLQPLGSPGPVTPMSLEGDGYMSLGRPLLGPGMEHRKDACSPMQLGALSV